MVPGHTAKICIVGGGGRMGRRVIEASELAPDVSLESILVADVNDAHGISNCRIETDPDIAFNGTDVVIDFSAPPSLERTLPAAMRSQTAYVLASTGLPQDCQELLDEAATKIPLIVASNCSLGVNVLESLVKTAARALGGFDIEIFELHHNQKRDAPSGTALTLADAVTSVRPLEVTTARTGNRTLRDSDSLGVIAGRGGDVAGEHTVFYFGNGERLELTHRATSPMIFADGALRAAKWLIERAPGAYTMADVLGLET